MATAKKTTVITRIEVPTVELILTNREAELLLGIVGRCTGPESNTIYQVLSTVVERTSLSKYMEENLPPINLHKLPLPKL
jgi:hypothetical protein